MGVPILYKQLGTIIKDRRRTLGLTQEQLANKLGISRASLANVETGRQRVLVHQLYKFAEQFGVGVATLLPDEAESSALEALDDLLFSENLSLSQRQQVAALLQRDSVSPSISGGKHDQVQRNLKTREGAS